VVRSLLGSGANRSASQVASFTSLLRPGTFFTCAAFARTRENRPSRMCQTGFQYTPVASIATCVHPPRSSHSASSKRPCVVVGKRPTSRSTFRLLTRRRQATTSTLCTSRPAHRLCNVFMPRSILGCGRREALVLRTLPNVFQGGFTRSGKRPSVDDKYGCSKGLRSNSVPGSLAPRQKPTSVPTAAQHIPFHQCGCAVAHGNSVK